MSAEVENKTVTEEKTGSEEPTKKIEETTTETTTTTAAEKEKEAAASENKEVTEKECTKEKKEPAAPAPPPPRVHKTDFQKDVVYLYQFSRTPVLPSLSAYCLKVETWLRLNNIKYEVCKCQNEMS